MTFEEKNAAQARAYKQKLASNIMEQTDLTEDLDSLFESTVEKIVGYDLETESILSLKEELSRDILAEAFENTIPKQLDEGRREALSALFESVHDFIDGAKSFRAIRTETNFKLGVDDNRPFIDAFREARESAIYTQFKLELEKAQNPDKFKTPLIAKNFETLSNSAISKGLALTEDVNTSNIAMSQNMFLVLNLIESYDDFFKSAEKKKKFLTSYKNIINL